MEQQEYKWRSVFYISNYAKVIHKIYLFSQLDNYLPNDPKAEYECVIVGLLRVLHQDVEALGLLAEAAPFSSHSWLTEEGLSGMRMDAAVHISKALRTSPRLPLATFRLMSAYTSGTCLPL